MKPWLLNEPVIRALADRLRDELPAELAELAGGLPADEAWVLEPPAAVFDYPAAIGELDQFPVLTLTDRPSQIRDDTGSSATGRHEVLIVIHLTQPDQRLLAWGLRRYVQAVVRVALRGRQLGTGSQDGAYGTGLSAIVPGEALEVADPAGVRTWHAWAGVVVWAEREELA